jgi:hypothetical protein
MGAGMVEAEMQKSWVEATLEARLARVGAPEELWDRVVCPRPSVRRSANAVRMSACATLAVAIIVLVWGFSLRTNRAGLQFASSNPSAVRAWVKANAGIDVPLHSGNLAGATVDHGRAEILYRVNGRNLTLVTGNGQRIDKANLSWSASGQTYMLLCAAPEDLKACALCHVGS